MEARLPSAGAGEGLVPVSVVEGAFLGVAQDVESFGSFLEAFDGRLVAGIAVGMIGRGRLALGALDVFGRSLPGDAQNFVILPFRGHRTHVSSAGKIALLKNYRTDLETGEEGVDNGRKGRRVEGVEEQITQILVSPVCAFVQFDVTARRVSEGISRHGSPTRKRGNLAPQYRRRSLSFNLTLLTFSTSSSFRPLRPRRAKQATVAGGLFVSTNL